MKRAYIAASLFIFPLLPIAATFFFIPPDSNGVYWQFNLMALVLYTGSAVMFLLAMRGFRQQFKVAYRFMSAGASMLMVGVFGVIGSRAFLGESLLGRVLSEVPFLFMAVFFYIGIRIYARLIGLNGMLTKAVGVVGVLVVLSFPLGFITALSGHSGLDPIILIQTFNRLLFTVTAILAYQVWRTTSPMYKRALALLSTYLAITAIMVIIRITDVQPWAKPFIPWYDPVYVLAGIALFVAALRFNQIAYAEKIKAAAGQVAATGRDTLTSVDIIVSVAGLASNLRAVDKILDPMRQITALQQGPHKQLSEAQQATLAKVYLQVEDYLVTKEPLRKFEQRDLRQMIELQFKDTVDEPAFWRRVHVESSHS
ncbi:MAG TPA: hypothetical protein VF733_05115 [Candidatus Saccharimonadales bacterium]